MKDIAEFEDNQSQMKTQEKEKEVVRPDLDDFESDDSLEFMNTVFDEILWDDQELKRINILK